jgi:formylglycine-generating enzyme required for sulfatase activity
MILAYVPSGEYEIGAADTDTQAGADERPRHRVALNGYWIDVAEVTNAMYARCVEEGACSAPASQDTYFVRGYYSSDNCASYPIVNVSWNDANAYCRWAGRELPTEAQWEAAARGLSGALFPWGDESPSATTANFCDDNCPSDDRVQDANDGYAGTAPVGSYPAGASLFGVLDLAGNVWEWVADWSSADYYAISPTQNATGPEQGTLRVLRGGSWINIAAELRSSNRHAALPELTSDTIGFRCALTPSP